MDDTGAPVGLANRGFPGFLQFDKNFKTPYSYTYSLGVQRELPGNFVVEVNYYGRLGRKLVAVGDAAQTLNFKDAASGPVPEKRIRLACKLRFKAGCPNHCTAMVRKPNDCRGVPVLAELHSNCGKCAQQFLGVGDLSSTILVLAENGLLNPNVALYAQTGANGYIGTIPLVLQRAAGEPP